ncbi:MAG TPA: SpoIIE family protein phosphatase [Clostridiales bacterium]|nr:SpoIIE family protein phosphatase [Clostridiales bacterium]HPZ05358.1 SpoIIE family protein phosphatase [Clostridiales bacterium]HQD31979.1 SpoIIE family protein phosphatase [Clostridiales bacterium]
MLFRGDITESLRTNRPFIEDILNGMYDWVRVIDRDHNVIYMNRAMSEGLGVHHLGKKCYEVLGRSEPCLNCTSRKSVFDGESQEKEEYIGDRSFSVMSSPLRNSAGEVIAAVEVLRETTQLKKLYHEMQDQNHKLKSEVEMARKLQTSLLPDPPDDPRLDFSMVYMPCESLGGDFVDIFYIDDSRLGVYIADVSGHGAQASLLTVFLRSTINKKLLSPAKALEELYYEFNQSKLDREMYISIFYSIIDLDAKTMLYSNAGLNVIPAVYGRHRFELLRLPGIPISNWLEKPEYKEGTINLSSGDRFFMYTDGILEIRNEANEQFGEDRLLEILLKSSSTPEQILRDIKESAFKFAGARSLERLQDDVTMALLELK